MRSEDPEYDHDSDEAKDVDEHSDVLHGGQIMSSPDIDYQAEDDNWDDEQETLPCWCRIVWVFDDEQTLDEGTDKECA